MAQLTLLQIVDAVTGELGLVSPTAVVGTNDLQTQQFLRLVNRSGDTLKRVHNWTVLQSLFTLNVGAPIVTTGTTLGGSPIISNIPTTAGIVAGAWVVTGSNIPVAARVFIGRFEYHPDHDGHGDHRNRHDCRRGYYLLKRYVS